MPSLSVFADVAVTARLPAVKPLALLIVLLLMLVGETALVSAQAQREQEHLRLLRSDADGVVVELTQPEFALRTSGTGRTACFSLHAEGYAQTDREGWPQLPVKSIMLGVPPNVNLSVSVLEHTETMVPGRYRLCPAPTVRINAGFPGPQGIPFPTMIGSEMVEAPEAYSSDAFYPAAVASLSEDGFIRQQRFVRLQIAPFQYNPVTQQLKIQRRLVIELKFIYPSGKNPVSWTSVAEPSGFEDVLRRSLLNYNTARYWRLSRTVRKGNLVQHGSPSPAYRMLIDRDGMYQVTYADLQAAGLPVDTVVPQTFQIFTGGREIAIYVEGETDGRFDPTDYVLFFGQGITSKFTRLNVYWLTYGLENGRRMPEKDGRPSGNTSLVLSSPDRVHLEVDSVYSYWPAMPGEDDLDRWYWNYALSPATLTYTAVLSNPTPDGYTATLRVQFYGYNDVAHRINLYVNGVRIGEGWWDGEYSSFWQEFQFPQSLLVSGQNTIQAESPNTATVDLNITDWLEVDYQRDHVADSDFLRFGQDMTGTWEYQVTGFDNDQIEVFDVAEPVTVSRILSGLIEYDGADYTLRFEVSQAAKADYIAETPAQRLTPVAIEYDEPSDLYSASHGADYLFITHANFYTSVLPLANYYAQQGLRTMVVDVQDVYDEFSYGVFTPHAIRDFLTYAYENWVAPAPSYVLLVGDGHFDFKNNNNFGPDRKRVYIPPYLAYVDPWMGETVADNRYVSVSGDDVLADMHLGRLPVNSIAQMTAMVSKTLDYLQNPPHGGWNSMVLFAADNQPDPAGAFVDLTHNLMDNFVPVPYISDTVFINDYCGPPTNPPQPCPSAASALRRAIGRGALFVNYIGHSSYSNWAAENLFGVSAVGWLTNTTWPIMLPMTCVDGYYISPYTWAGADSLGETVVRAAGKGAVASWSPTGLGVVQGHEYLNEGFLEGVLRKGIRQLGPATMAGKLRLYNDSGGTHLELLDTYLLLGDPALRINALDADLQLEKTIKAPTTVQPGDVLTYTLAFTNAGPAMAHGLVLTDLLSPLLVSPTVVYSSTEVLSRRVGVTFAWDITDLLPGDGGAIQFRVVVSPTLTSGIVVNQASISANEPDPDPATNVASVTVGIQVPDLFVTKTGPAAVAFSQTITYTISWGNQGSLAASGVRLTDTLPAWVEYVTDSSALPHTYDPVAHRLVWTVPFTAPTGAHETFVLTGQVTVTQPTTMTLVNQARIGAAQLDGDPANNLAQWRTDITAGQDRFSLYLPLIFKP